MTNGRERRQDHQGRPQVLGRALEHRLRDVPLDVGPRRGNQTREEPEPRHLPQFIPILHHSQRIVHVLPRELLQRLDGFSHLVVLHFRALPRLLQRLLEVPGVLGLGEPRVHLHGLDLLLFGRVTELAGRQLNALDARVRVRRLLACVVVSSTAYGATQKKRTPQTHRAPRSGTPRTAGRGRAP